MDIIDIESGRNLAEALKYAARGWQSFPLKPRAKEPATPRRAAEGKGPPVSTGATPDQWRQAARGIRGRKPQRDQAMEAGRHEPGHMVPPPPEGHHRGNAVSLPEKTRPAHSRQIKEDTMKPRDAEEYTQSLGLIVAGSWRQIEHIGRQDRPH